MTCQNSDSDCRAAGFSPKYDTISEKLFLHFSTASIRSFFNAVDSSTNAVITS